MANPAESEVQNLLPVQAFFDAQGNFQTFIGQNKPFFATPDPQQSGLHITNSTIDSSVIGGITPAAGNFTTATVLTQPSSATDVVNLLALQAYAAGISWKQPCNVATLANITLSGLQTIDGYTVSAGDRVLVKNQTNAAQNGIYSASATAWTRTTDADVWDELIAAISFIEYGTQAGGAFFCTAQSGGTIDVTANIWAQFTTSATYTAGTGLTLTGFEFSITPVGTAGTYGSASSVPVFTTNASGQVSSVTNTTIAIGATQIASGTIDSARLSGSYSGITGLGTLTDLTVTNPIVGSVTGNAGTATTAVTATNLAGGATGSLPYQTAAGTTGFLAAGTNGQILALASGIPSWIDNQVGTVTSVSGTGTVSGISLSGTVTSTGSLTLGGTLDLSSPPTIGNTAPNTGRFTTLTVDDNTTLGSSNTDTVTFTARVNSDFDPAVDNAYDLGRTGHEWRDLYIDGTANIDSLIADTADINAGTIDNTVIGGTTPVAGTFTDLRFNGTLSLAGSTGTAGYVLTSNGASAPTWQANANGLAITDDTTTNATRYLTFTSATSGSITGANVSSTQLAFNPSTGNLGIGTSSPGAKLNVSSNVEIARWSSSSATGNNYQTFVNSGGRKAYLGLASGSTDDFFIHNDANAAILFDTNNAERMRITSAGDVGIGTSSPGAKLQVTTGGANSPGSNLSGNIGQFTSSGGIAYVTMGNGDSANQHRYVGAASAIQVFGKVTDAGVATEQMRIDSDGNVGIGTSSPGYKLDVNGTANYSSYINLAVNQNVQWGGGDAAISNAGTALIFKTFSGSLAERMRIDSSGNLLVGATSGNSKVTVNSTSLVGITSAITDTSQLTTVGLLVQKADNNSTTSNWFQAFSINNGAAGSGIITANGASQAAFGSFSDERLKENIVDLPSQLQNIVSLRPVEFDYKAGGHQIGFIAQEMQQIFPDAVSDDGSEDKYLTVTGWSKTEARLVKAIQEQQALIESLTTRLNALEGK
jgi:hypothetical protein